jgi:hypothetical protein
MHSRRIACLLLGLWMGAGLWMLWVAEDNAASVQTLLRRPSAAAEAYLKTLGRTPVGPLAQYLAAEQNRSLFETWGVVQIALSGVFFFFLLFGTRLGKVPLALALLLFLIALGERLAISPGMELVGRATDFAADPSHRLRLARDVLSYGYATAEIAKWLLAVAVACFLIWQRTSRSLDSGQEVDMVDKANYRHIDR